MISGWRTPLLVLLLTLLALHSIGVWLCAILSALCVAFISGAVLAINDNRIAKERANRNVLFELKSPGNESHALTKGLSMVEVAIQEGMTSKDNYKGRELTGVKQLDEVISKMIELSLRYFVQNWYSKLNSDLAFLVETRLLIENCVTTGSDRVKSADWFLFLTSRLLQEVVTHLRLYKAAQQQMLAQTLRQDEKQDLDSAKILSVEDWFFKIEQERTEDSFQAVCTISASEYVYQKRLIDILMLHLMPVQEYDCLLLRDLLKEVFSKRVFNPAINYVSNPQTINYVIHTRVPGSLTPKALVKYLESAYVPAADLKCLISFLEREIQELTRKGTSDREHTHLENLKGMKMHCKRRLKQLIVESTKLELPSTPTEGRAMKKLLSNVVLSDQVIDFLGRSKETRREAQFLEDVMTFANTYKFVDASDGEAAQLLMRDNAVTIFSNYLTISSNTYVQLETKIIGNLSRTLSDHSPVTPDLFDEAVENVCSRLQEQGVYRAFLSYYDPQTSIHDENMPPGANFGPLDHSNIVLECSTIKCSVSDFSIESETNLLSRSTVQYKLDIECCLEDGLVHSWSVQKRFSDFETFHKGIIDHSIYLPPDLSLPQRFGIFAPSTQVLAEGRRRAIEAYISRLLDLIRALPALRDELAKFFAPQTLINGPSAKLSGPIQNGNAESNSDSDQLIKRLLELMREIFDLRTEEDQSLYISLNSIILQSLIKTTQAEKVHRKLYDNFTEYTDPSFLAVLLTMLTDSIWPQGIFRGLSVPPPDKNSDVRKHRVEILARMHLLNSPPEELVALLYSKVTDKGMNRLFDLMQHTALNKRFIYVIIESALEFLLPSTVVKQELSQFRSELTSLQTTVI